MNKLLLGLLLASSFTLTGCGGFDSAMFASELNRTANENAAVMNNRYPKSNTSYDQTYDSSSSSDSSSKSSGDSYKEPKYNVPTSKKPVACRSAWMSKEDGPLCPDLVRKSTNSQTK